MSYFEIREITQSFHMLSMSKTIDSEILLSIIENRKALATDNRLISIIVTSLVIFIIKMRSNDFHVREIYDTNPTDSFPLQPGVSHGCLLPHLLFVMWMTKKTKEDNKSDRQGIVLDI